ncbi:hypothetical protein [Leptospira levettii]|uniref:Uncharacterized protein n=1 Tax=Leptospira levettii TaxID=2023178 RepID=A0AAW5UXL9_9LEPT|nr:hypothetical protein [Leptospira levettii]MCW7465690.1 hypothetical protein [Leptospira levettii]MCW7510429.1 hypothetical protein [Leptospira levettii]MCW7514181.1 hypothetical protein [Leptospira levettii]
MNLVLNLMITLVFLSGCHPREITKEEITSLRDQNKSSLIPFAETILPKILGTEFKNIESTFNNDKQNEVHVTYGSNSALTFNDPSEYRKVMTEYHSLVLLRIGYVLNLHHFDLLSLSLSKPFFIQGEKNPETEIQEAEIYRTTMKQMEIAKFFENHPNFDPFKAPMIGEKEWERITEELQKLWKVDLDEISRVKVE